MMRWLVPLLFAVAASAQTPQPASPENNLPSTSTVSDSDSIRVIQGGVSKKAAAGVVRNMTSSHLNDLTKVGKAIITTATPPAGISYYIRINPDLSITYLTQGQLLSDIGAQPASITIQTLDGSVIIPGFSVLQVPNGSLTDLGGGVAQLTYGQGSGTGQAFNTPTGYLPTDKLVTVDNVTLGGSVTGLINIDIGSNIMGFWEPNSTATDASLVMRPKGNGSVGITDRAGQESIIVDANGVNLYHDSGTLVTQGYISADGISLVTGPNFAAMRGLLGLAIGTNVQASNTNLDDLADGSLTG